MSKHRMKDYPDGPGAGPARIGYGHVRIHKHSDSSSGVRPGQLPGLIHAFPISALSSSRHHHGLGNKWLTFVLRGTVCEMLGSLLKVSHPLSHLMEVMRASSVQLPPPHTTATLTSWPGMGLL